MSTPEQRLARLALDDHFVQGSDLFLDCLRQVHSGAALAPLVERWKKDPRPWAARMRAEYFLKPLVSRGHQVVAKRLFKHAEATGEQATLAAAFRAFDLLVRRKRVRVFRYDRASGTAVESFILRERRTRVRKAVRKPDGRWIAKGEQGPDAPIFTHRTRYYLRRRVWRHCRRLAARDPGGYVDLLAEALLLYRDEDLAKGENLLDSRSLMLACFEDSPLLVFGRARTDLAEGAELGRLEPAPAYAEAWRTERGAWALCRLVRSAPARAVRQWAMRLLERHWASSTQGLDSAYLADLLAHADPEVRAFAAGALEKCPDLGLRPLAFWLDILRGAQPGEAEGVCEAFARHVSPDRLSAELCVELARERLQPVARIGFDALRAATTGPLPSALLRRLAGARCDSLGRDIAAWALAELGRHPPDLEAATDFFDSPSASVRAGAWDWLRGPSCPFARDARLWARLVETPHDDLRFQLVEALREAGQARPSGPAHPASDVDLFPVWTSVLLGVHRGGRSKPVAVRQLAAAVQRAPGRADELLPVLVAAARSTRAPEARAALSALAGLHAAAPALADAVARHCPELVITGAPA